MQNTQPTDGAALHELSDLELVELTKAGIDRAFGHLWNRHWSAGIAAARATTWGFDHEDLVTEAFTRILAAIRRGGGPKTAFRAYLRITLQNVARSWAANQVQLASLDAIHDIADTDGIVESTELLERAALAFESLPVRWRDALRLSEIDGLTNDEMAVALNLNPNAIAALTFRARQGLRRAYEELSESSLSDRRAA